MEEQNSSHFLWDDTELIRLFEQQLKAEGESPSSVSSTSSEYGSAEASPTVEESTNAPNDEEHSRRPQPQLAAPHLTIPHPPSLTPDMANLQPLLEAYYAAGYAAGTYMAKASETKAANRKRERA